MEQFHINHWAVLTCAVANLALGAIWYSPVLFYKAWMKENKFTEEDIKKSNPLRTHGLSFLLSVIIGYNLAFFLGDEKTDMAWGITAGFLNSVAGDIFLLMVVILRFTSP
jgi:Protein of unknown function (DUF1761)